MTDISNLTEFLEVIRSFKLSERVHQKASQIGFKLYETIDNIQQLYDVLMEHNWRANPMQYDIPSTSQIFGQLLQNSGINGIVYLSKYTNRKNISIFPKTFELSKTYIKIDDSLPEEITVKRLDSTNYNCYSNLE